MNHPGLYFEISQLLQFYQLYPDESGIYAEWTSLVDKYQVRGKTAHDARLVAAMKHHRIRYVITFNVADFERYQPEIQVLDPQVVQSESYILVDDYSSFT